MKLIVADQARGQGEARVLETDGERVSLQSSLPFPTGATLVGIEPGSGVEYRVKVRGGRREEDGFRIEGRFVSLTKEQRAAVLRALDGEDAS